MPLLMMRELPRYECLNSAAERYPSLEPLAFEAFLHLLRTGDVVYAAEGRFLAQQGVSHGAFNVMMMLNCKGANTPAELADEAGVSRATMTGLLDTLEKEGWARREIAPEDRRATLVHLTPAGEAFLEATLPDYFGFVSKLIQPLADGERRQLVTLLQKVQQAQSRPAPAAAELAETH